MTKEEISKRRSEIIDANRRATRKRMFEDWWVVAGLLVFLKLAGAFTSGWNSWGTVLLLIGGYIVGDLIWLGVKSLFRRR